MASKHASICANQLDYGAQSLHHSEICHSVALHTLNKVMLQEELAARPDPREAERLRERVSVLSAMLDAQMEAEGYKK